MIKLHYHVAEALEACLKRIEAHEAAESNLRQSFVVEGCGPDRAWTHARSIRTASLAPNSETNSETTLCSDDEGDHDGFHQIELLDPANS